MLKHTKITFLGGDARSLAMAQRVVSLGGEVTAYAMGEMTAQTGITAAPTLDAALVHARAVVLPMPAFDGQLCVPCPYAKEQHLPNAAALLSCIGSSIPVFGGRVSPAVFALASELAVNISDYSVSDEVLIRNAVPTAEGAIGLAMQALDVTLHGARVAVLGFGRIGFALATRLHALGAHVTVAARKARDLARIDGIFCRAHQLCNEYAVRHLLEDGYDVIFNTVPYRLISNDALSRIPSHTVLIELASAPGGWDASAHANCTVIYAPGLPARCAPRTAGNIMGDALIKMIGEVIGV